MRTTVILPDELMRLAKERARAEGRTFTSFLEDAMRRELARRHEQRQEPFVLAPVSGVPGEKPLIDITDKDALWDVLDEDDFTVQQIRREQGERS